MKSKPSKKEQDPEDVGRRSSETSISVCHTIRRLVPEDGAVANYRPDNLECSRFTAPCVMLEVSPSFT
jgi:hypothetical protein